MYIDSNRKQPLVFKTGVVIPEIFHQNLPPGIVDITLFLTGEVELSQAHHSLGVMGHDRFQGFFTPGEETSLCQWTVLWST